MDLGKASKKIRYHGWIVVRVRPQYLVRAIENMERQGCECYSPRGMVRSKRTHTLRVQALFPGYVFARYPEGRWSFLRGTFGVLGIIMGTGDSPAKVPDWEIERLRGREGPDGLIRLEAGKFAIGEHVRVDGVLLGDAIVDGMSSRDRVFVLMQMMGRWVRAEVDVRDIRK